METNSELTISVIETIGRHIDEKRLYDDIDSFVEMDQQVIHVVSDKYGERYFRVKLEEVTEDEYWGKIPPDNGIKT